MSNDKLKKRGGFYWREFQGKLRPYISVTTVKEIISVPALDTWRMQIVYRAFLEDPTLTEKDALLKPMQVMRKAANRGSLVHSIAEAYNTSGFTEPDVSKEQRGYVDAFYKYERERGEYMPFMKETTVYSDFHGVAGTFDELWTRTQTNEVVLDDYKTSKDSYPENWLQLSAYKALLKEDKNVDVDEIRNIILREDGTYTPYVAEYCFDVFLAALELWKWRNRELLKQIGWFGGEKK